MMSHRARRALSAVLSVMGKSMLVAWCVSTSAASSGAALAYLDARPSGSVVQTVVRPFLALLWLPAKASDAIFSLAQAPFHSAEDAVENIVAYMIETLVVTYVISVVVFLVRMWLARYRSHGTKGEPKTAHAAR